MGLLDNPLLASPEAWSGKQQKLGDQPSAPASPPVPVDILSNPILSSPDSWKRAMQTPQSSGSVLPLRVTNEPAKDMPWSEVGIQAIKNTPASAYQMGKNIVEAVAHPIDTAQSIYGLGKGLVSKAGLLGSMSDAERKEVEKYADAAKQFYVDRYGTPENFKRAIAEDPVGVLGDVSMALTGGGGLLRGAGVASKAAGAAKTGEVAGAIGRGLSTVGAYSDPIGGTLGAAKALTKGVIAPAIAVPASLASGTSHSSMTQAARAGLEYNPVFWGHVWGSRTGADLTQAVEDALQKAADARRAEYVSSRGSLANTTLSYKNVIDAMRDNLNSLHNLGDPTKHPGTIKMFNNMQTDITNWMNNPARQHTLLDFDDLKKAIYDRYRGETAPGSFDRHMVDKMTNAIKDTINAADPKYGKMMEAYQEATNTMRDMRNEFVNKLSPSKTPKKALNDIDSSYKQKLLKEMTKYNPDIPAMLAGHELSSVMPVDIRNLAGRAMIAGSLPSLAVNPLYGIGTALMAAPKIAGTAVGAVTTPVGISSAAFHKAPILSQGIERGSTLVREMDRRKDRLDEAPPITIRPRKSGGRVVVTGDDLIAAVERAKRQVCKSTEPLLNVHDNHIAETLDRANESFGGMT